MARGLLNFLTPTAPAAGAAGGPAPGPGANLAGLLAGGNPLFNVGMGLLAASGPSPVPMSAGQRMAQGFQHGADLTRAGMQNQLLRERVDADQRRRAAIAELGRMAGEGDDPRRAEMIGLLGEVAPEAFAQGLLGQFMPAADRLPSNVRTARFLYPDDPDAQRKWLLEHEAARRTGGVDAIIAAQQEERLRRMQQEREKAEREGREAEAKKIEETARREDGVRSAFRTAREMVQHANLLEGTSLQPGRVGVAERAIALRIEIEALERGGRDASEQKRTLASYERFRNLATQGFVESLRNLPNLGVITQQKFDQLREAFADPTVSLPTIRATAADVLESTLAGARANQIDPRELGLGSEQDIREEIKRLRGTARRDEGRAPATVDPRRDPDQARTPTDATPAEIARMDAEQLNRLALDHDLTPEQDAALARRGLELNIGGTARPRTEGRERRPTGPTPGEIGRMSPEALYDLDFDNLTPAQRRALSRRLNALGFK